MVVRGAVAVDGGGRAAGDEHLAPLGGPHLASLGDPQLAPFGGQAAGSVRVTCPVEHLGDLA